MLLDITASSELRYLEEHLLWCARLATESHECFYIVNGISESCLLPVLRCGVRQSNLLLRYL